MKPITIQMIEACRKGLNRSYVSIRLSGLTQLRERTTENRGFANVAIARSHEALSDEHKRALRAYQQVVSESQTGKRYRGNHQWYRLAALLGTHWKDARAMLLEAERIEERLAIE